MSSIDPKDIMTLRQKSGLTLMACKAALENANGDIALAESNIRKAGLSNMDGNVHRPANQGCIAVAASEDCSKCSIVEINTETDFTAKNDGFVAMANDIARLALQQVAGDVVKTEGMQNRVDDLRLATKENVTWRRAKVFDGGKMGSYVHHDRKTGVVVQVDGEIDSDTLRKLCLHVASAYPAPRYIDDSSVPADVIANESDIARAQALASGRPANIIEKMVEGKLAKFLDGIVLMRQRFVMNEDMQIKDIIPKGVTVRQFAKYVVGEDLKNRVDEIAT